MKKQLKAALVKLAEEILQNQNNLSAREMQEKARTIYEKLSILNFVEENLADENIASEAKAEVKPERKPEAKTEATVEAPREETKVAEEVKKEPVPSEELLFSAEAIRRSNYQPEYEQETAEDAEEIVEPNTEKIKNIVAEMPEEEIEPEPVPDTPQREEKIEEPESLPQHEEPKKLEENTQEEQPKATGFDFGVDYDNLPQFEPKSKTEESPQPPKPETPPANSYAAQSSEPATPKQNSTPNTNVNSQQPTSLNSKLRRGINIGLNDRIAFIKHLFNGSAADYNRVLSQLNTFTNQQEAYDFIAQVVKPDYNNWEGKEVYEARFLDIIDGKFN